MQKIILSETKIVYGYINEIAKVNYSHIAQSIHKEKVSNNAFDIRSLYNKIDWTRDLQWATAYIQDHFNGEYDEALHMSEKDSFYGLNQPKNQQIEWHTHFDVYNVKHSPDYVVLYCLSEIKNSPDIIIEYPDHRDKGKYWKMPIETNKFIIINGDLRFKITNNNNDNDINYVVLRYYNK